MTFKTTSIFRLGLWVGLSLMGWLFVSCNTEPEVEHRIDLFLNDSLSFDNGNYDSLQISIVSTTGAVIQPLVFHGKYKSDSTGGVLKGLLLGSAVPSEFDIVIKAFHKEGDTVSVKITVKDKEAGSVVRIDTIKTGPVDPPVGPGDSDTVVNTNSPTGIALSESVMTLGVSSEPRQIFAVLQPAGASGLVQFRSTDTTVATVSDNGFIAPVAVGEALVIASVISHPHLADTVRVRVIVPPAITQVAFAGLAPVLYVGAPGIKLDVAHLPADLTPVLEFKSSDDGVIEVSANGTVSAKAEGSAIITVSAVGSTSVTDTLTVRALRDAPFINAGSTQSVAIGQPVTIKVKVTQAYGTLTLSWDFTGDGQPEGQSTQDSATATHTYASEGDYSAVFTAKDGEGNTTTQTVRIRVGKAGPLVIITKPKQDTLVNTSNFTVSYTSDGAPKTQAFILLEGLNLLTVKDSNATGTDSAWVKVRLDTKAPVVKITAPADRSITNLPEIDVAWSVDSVARGTQLKESLVGKQGLITIARSFTDSAGNYGRDTIVITRDTVPPSAPVFAGGDTTMNTKLPTWSWTSGGGGNGTFAVQLGAGTAQELTTTTFTPAAPLNDGIYTLTIRERDAAGNWSAWRSKTITIKTTGPGAPTFSSLTTASPTNDKTPTWAWISSGVIGGGSGFFRWSVTTPTPVTDSGIATSFTPLGELIDGTYTLTLQERDALGNWSSPVTRDIRILTAGALVEITVPVRGSYINVKSGVVTVAWSVNGAPQTTGLSHTLTVQGANLIRREFRDVANNLSFDTLTVFWDTVAPVVAITSPANGATVNTLSLPIAWTVNNTAQTSQTTESLSAGNGLKTITRTSTDLAGNMGTASVQVTLDTTAPAVPTFTSSTTASPTNNSRPTWAWSGTGPFEYRMSEGGAPTSAGIAITTASFTPASGSPLTSGTWHLQVRERDAVGNWSAWSASRIIEVDLASPGAPSPTAVSPTRDQTPTWTWAGTGPFEYHLSNTTAAPPGSGTAITTTTFTPTTNLAEGTWRFYVRERDAAMNWSPWSTASLVEIDITAPTVTISSPANGAAVNSFSVPVTWSVGGGAAQSNTETLSGSDGAKTITRTGTDAAGNVGTASVQVILDMTAPTITNPGNRAITTTSTTLSFTAADGSGSGVAGATCAWGTTTVNATNSGGTWNCNITGLNTKNTTVTLRATDNVGRNSSTTITITLNLPITPISVDAKYQNYPISGTSITVPYTEGSSPGTPRTQTFTGLVSGNNARTIQGPANAIGERDSENINIVVLPNVVFVRAGGTGDASGTSWDNAEGDLHSAMNSTSSQGKEIWVAAGSYSRNGRWDIISNIKVYGGFPSTGYPFRHADRNWTTNASTISGQEVLSFDAGDGASNSKVDGFYFQNIGAWIGGFARNDTLSNISITGSFTHLYGVVFVQGQDILLNNVTISGLNLGDLAGIYIYTGGNVKIRDGNITNNSTADWNAALYILNGKVDLEGSLRLIGNTTPNMNGFQVQALNSMGGTTLDVSSGVQVQNNRDGIYLGSTDICLNYKGSPPCD
jgi:PKD domain